MYPVAGVVCTGEIPKLFFQMARSCSTVLYFYDQTGWPCDCDTEQLSRTTGRAHEFHVIVTIYEILWPNCAPQARKIVTKYPSNRLVTCDKGHYPDRIDTL